VPVIQLEGSSRTFAWTFRRKFEALTRSAKNPLAFSSCMAISRNPLHQLQNARALACGVLAWLILSLVAATVSPVMAKSFSGLPDGQICSASGPISNPAAETEKGSPTHSSSGWHCALCFTAVAPVSVFQAGDYLARPERGFHFVSLAAPLVERWVVPPPGRGPPVHT